VDYELSQHPNEGSDEWTPTYRSPSLLYPRPSGRHTQPAEEHITESSVPARTFADMARHFCSSDNEGGSMQSASSPISLAGIIKLQPNRKAGHKLWRPMQASDQVGTHGAGYDNSSTSSIVEKMGQLLSLDRSTPSSFRTASPHNRLYDLSSVNKGVPSACEHRAYLADGDDTVKLPITVSGTGSSNSTVPNHFDVSDRYAKLFGPLPDPIRLHEQLGEFDGQVVFIGHPNRDISAHQWSSASFQWENIGRYAHSRGKIEGSLASDRVREHDTSHNAMVNFKLAAETRQKLITEHGRNGVDAVDMVPPSRTDVFPSASTNTISKVVDTSVSDHTYSNFVSGHPFKEVTAAAGTTLRDTIKKQPLEDPFVAKTNAVEVGFPFCVQSRFNVADAKGSLDLAYKFPARSTGTLRPPMQHNTSDAFHEQQLHAGPDRSSTFCGGTQTHKRMTRPSLREVDVGEDAASAFAFSAERDNSSYPVPILPFQKTIEYCQKLGDRISTSSEYMKRSDAPAQGRVAVPRFEGLQPTARSLYPSLGMTVANPHRIFPRVDTTGPAYTQLSVPVESSKVSESGAAIADITASTALLFSDPDSLRQTQEHEIANGLSQQAPTVQNFKGPFFTGTKPTTHDPTVSLSVHVNEEEKLRNWYCDGHRPARQREYANTLVSAAAISGRSRCLGAIGEVRGATHDKRTESTMPFVRLYEGLSEYIEEYQNGSGGSYFTRSWKAAPSHLRHLGPDGNNSYFADAGVASSRVYQRQARNQ
jgi:hypothetical protein